jgi:DNA-binding CsgD family transcriptional regulator
MRVKFGWSNPTFMPTPFHRESGSPEYREVKGKRVLVRYGHKALRFHHCNSPNVMLPMLPAGSEKDEMTSEKRVGASAGIDGEALRHNANQVRESSAAFILELIREDGNGSNRKDRAFICLSPREREVLSLLARGRSTKEIALQLALSDKTIETHRRATMAKLQLFSVADLTRYAIREGLASLRD